MTKRRPQPLRLAWLAMAGACLMPAAVLLFFAPHAWFKPTEAGLFATLWERRWLLGAALSPLLLGGVLRFWAERRLRQSFLDDGWSDAEREAVLRVVSFRRWQMCGLAFFACWVFLLFFRHSVASGGLAYLLILPSHTAHRLRSMIAPKATAAPLLQAWRAVAPLQSEHWGEGRP